ncbi:MAG: iron hydrogenase [Candidatus Berkelbacteria bacterium]|nr:iron hydrogenase [Candidatus Berkelbacteria bacterium]
MLTKTMSISLTSIRVAVFTLFLSISVAAPLLHNQLITGPIVNAMLFLAVIFLGAKEAMMIGLLPSLISLSVGLLPIVLAPMIPFIMVGNALLVIVFDIIRSKNQWLGFIGAALVKFVFIFGSSTIVIHLLDKPGLVAKATQMMGSIQLTTALIGALLASVVIGTIDKSIFKTK